MLVNDRLTADLAPERSEPTRLGEHRANSMQNGVTILKVLLPASGAVLAAARCGRMPIELPQSDVRAIANLPDFSGLPILRPAIISDPFSPAELPPGRRDLLVLIRSNTGW